MLNQRYTCSKINDKYLKILRYEDRFFDPKIRFNLIAEGMMEARKIVGEILNSRLKHGNKFMNLHLF